MIVDYNNYIDQIKQEFPELSKKSIKDILKHGFKNYIRFSRQLYQQIPCR